jgi:hypothetical protein
MVTGAAAVQVPLITASGTIVAAMITGFLAAMLKHRWDKEASAETWRQERSERRRAELKVALVEYLRICRQIEEVGNRLWYDHTRKRYDSELRRLTKEEDRPVRDAEGSGRLHDADDSWYSKLGEGAAAADLLIIMLGIDVADPFRRHMIDLRTWIDDMTDRGDRGADVVLAPPTKHLKSIAYEILRRP